MPRINKEQVIFEANQYFDGEEILKQLRTAGMHDADVILLIELRKARALNDILLMLADIQDKLNGRQ